MVKAGQWIGIALLVLALVGCQSTDNGAVLEQRSGSVIFRVGTTTVTVEDFQQRMERDIGTVVQQLLSQGQTPEQIIEQANQANVRQSIFDSMIQEELLLQFARQQGIGVDPQRVDAQIDQSQAIGGDPRDPQTNLFADLTQQRIREAREQIVTTIIARYTRADMFKARHILVEDESTADKVLEELRNGKLFADLAREYSTDPGSQGQGGELGWVAQGDFVPEFEQAAFSSELNTPVKVQSEFGWHIIEVLDRQLNRPFDSIDQLERSQNAQQFFEATFVPWYDNLRQQAEASGDLQINPTFDPNSVPLPFGSSTPANNAAP